MALQISPFLVEFFDEIAQTAVIASLNYWLSWEVMSSELSKSRFFRFAAKSVNVYTVFILWTVLTHNGCSHGTLRFAYHGTVFLNEFRNVTLEPLPPAKDLHAPMPDELRTRTVSPQHRFRSMRLMRKTTTRRSPLNLAKWCSSTFGRRGAHRERGQSYEWSNTLGRSYCTAIRRLPH